MQKLPDKRLGSAILFTSPAHTRSFGLIPRFLTALIAALVLAGCVTDITAPAEVGNLKAVAGDKKVVLTWTDPADSDFAYVEIRYKSNYAEFWVVHVAPGIQTIKITDHLTNGEWWRFDVYTWDTNGNSSYGKLARACYGLCPP